jgi:DNA-directed RNA polymerase subunit RPC12/RpoP
MSETELREALEAYADQDLLFGAKRKEDAFLRQIVCPRCGGETSPCFSSIRTVFAPDQIPPRHNVKCKACGAEVDPRNGVLLSLGNIGKAIEQGLAQQTPWINPGDEG